MAGYILKRMALLLPTLLGILLVNFLIVQTAPGGPVESLIVQLTDPSASGVGDRVSGASSDLAASAAGNGFGHSSYRGAQGIDPELLADIKKQYGFDKPLAARFWQMLGNYAMLDFGTSFFRDASVLSLIADKLPVSVSLGLWSTLLVYLISIPLGIRKAVHDGSRFDVWTSTLVVIGQAVPGFLFAVLLLVLFAGGSYVQWFPLRGLVSENFDDLSIFGQVMDYFWHLILPITAMVIGGFASLTLLTKNSFIEEINKQYVLTARAKGLPQKRVLYRHVFRNAMLIVVAGIPSALLSILFTSALMIEVIFSLDGLGLLGFEAALNRDYPVMFGTLFIFTLLGLVFKLLGDIAYMFIDPRIDFEARQ